MSTTLYKILKFSAVFFLTGFVFFANANFAQAAITYVGGRGAGIAGKTSTTSVAINSGLTGGSDSGVSAGDLVVVTVSTGTQARAPGTAVISPTGYTALTAQRTTATTYDTNVQTSYKFMTETPDTTVTIPTPGNTADGQGYTVHVFRGVDPTTPQDVTSTYATGSGVNNRPDPASITPTTSGAWIYFGGGGAAATGGTYTAGYISGLLTYQGADTNDGSVGAGYYSGWSSGAYDGAGWTGGSVNAANSWGVTTLALRPYTANNCSSTGAGGNFNSSASWTSCGGTTPKAGDTITINSGSPITVTATAVVSGVTVNSGATLTVNTSQVLRVVGDFTLNSSGTVTGAGGLEISSSDKTIYGSGSISGLTGTTTLTGNKTIDSAASLTFGGTVALSASTEITNNGSITLNAATAMTGANASTSIWTQGTDSLLNISHGGTAFFTTGTLTATASGNTVSYSRSGTQTAKVTTYNNLTISGTSAKTFATTPTVNGTLTLDGTATVTVTSGVVTYGANAKLRYITSTARTASSETWLTTFAATGGIELAGTGAITLNENKVLNNGSPLVINANGELNTSSFTLTAGDDLTINGTLSGTGEVTMGTTDGKILYGTGNKTNSGLFTFDADITIDSTADLTISGGAILIGTNDILTNNGTVYITENVNGNNNNSQWTQGANSYVRVSGDFMPGNGNLDAQASGNTVEYAGTNQDMTAGGFLQGDIFKNLIISGSNNTGPTFTVDNVLTVSGTWTPSSGTVTLSGSGTPLSIGGTFTPSGTSTITYSNSGATITNTTFNNLTISAAITASTTTAVAGVLTTSAAFAPSAGTITLNNGSSIVTSGSAPTFFNLTVASGATVTTSSNFSIENTFTNSSTASFTASSGSVITALSATIANSGTLLSFYDLTIGTGTTVANTNLTISNLLTVTGTLSPTSGIYTFSGSGSIFTNNGTYTASGTHTDTFTNSGTVTINGSTSSTTFFNFTAATSSTALKFKEGNTYVTNGLLTLTNVSLDTDTGSGTWTINHQGTESVNGVTVTRSACHGSSTGITVTTGTDGGSNGVCWIFPVTGISIAGSANGNDAATVKVAVNGTLQTGKTAVIGSSAWSITGVTTPSVDDIITVWVDGVADNLESTAVTKWASGNVTGMVLNTNVLTIGSNQNSSISLANLGLYDADQNEDIMHTSNSGVLLTQGATNSYSAETLSILPSNTLNVGSTEIVNTKNLANAGVLVSGSSSTTYYRAITIDYTKVPNTDQTDFPVLIAGTYNGSGGTPDLRTVANGGKVQNVSGYDIGFYSDPALTTRLSWEKEKYVATTGEISYWVKVPSLSHTANTVIYMAYGNPSITTDQSNPTNVWNSNYLAVWHYPDGTTLTANDSTASGVNSSSISATATTGKIDGGAAFNGTSQNILFSNSLDMTGSEARSWSFWVKPTNTTTDFERVIIGKNSDTAAHATPGWTVFRYGTDIYLQLNAGSGYQNNEIQVNSYNVLTGGVWNRGVVTYDGSKNATTGIKIYVNGVSKTVSVGSNTLTNSISTSVNVSSGSTSTSTKYFNGDMDEISITNNVLSADWVATEYNNQNSPSAFYSVGSENNATVYPLFTIGGNWTNTGSVTAGSSLIKVTDSSSNGVTFAGGGSTYNNMWFNRGASTGSITISGDNTFNDFKDTGTAAHSLLFTTGSTQTMSSWSVSGTGTGSRISIDSTTTGTHNLVLNNASGSANANYLNIQHSVASPFSRWFAGNDSVNNNQGAGCTATCGSGWIFYSKTIYQGIGGAAGGEISSGLTGSGATATAVRTGETVTSVNVITGGTNYNSTVVSFCGGGGTGAAAYATLASGVVTGVTVTANGSGYTSDPTVIFSATCGGGSGGGGSSTATGTPVLSGNTIASVTMTNNGSGYTVPPIVKFCGGGGSNAAGTAVLSGDTVASVTMTNNGSGYNSSVTVIFGSECPSGGGGGGGGGDLGFNFKFLKVFAYTLNPLFRALSLL